MEMIAKANTVAFAPGVVRCIDDLRRNGDAAMDVLGGQGRSWNGQSRSHGNGNEMPV